MFNSVWQSAWLGCTGKGVPVLFHCGAAEQRKLGFSYGALPWLWNSMLAQASVGAQFPGWRHLGSWLVYGAGRQQSILAGRPPKGHGVYIFFMVPSARCLLQDFDK